MVNLTTFISILQRLFILGLFFLICAACNKDKNEIIETIEPGSYFPVYPGSYWRYIDSNGDTLSRTTGPKYVEDIYYVGGVAKQGPYYVPLYEGKPIWGYYEHYNNLSHSYDYPGFVLILSDSMYSWNTYISRTPALWRKVVFRDSSINVLGHNYYPTIMVEEYRADGTSPNLAWEYKRYYAKHIGLIKEEHRNYSGVYTIYLLDYHINY